MKRFLLSSIILGSFIAFSIYYRILGQSTSSTILTDNTNPQQPTSSSSESTSVTSETVNTLILPTQTPSFGYKNGTFVGDVADAFYGNIQVQIVMQGGKITDVQFLQYPNDRSHSIQINEYAMPILKSEAIQAQNVKVDIVSGATDSSQAFIQSLQSALQKAKS